MKTNFLGSSGLLSAGALALAMCCSPAAAANFKILHQFCTDVPTCKDGYDLEGPLLRDAQGNLYGTARQGGTPSFGGTLFRLHPLASGKWKFDVLHDFCHQADCADGFLPTSSLVLDRAGNLYGVASARVSTEQADSVVYKLRPRAGKWAYEVLHEFCQGATCEAVGASAGLAYAGQAAGVPYDGKSPLYGVAPEGGANNGGIVYSIEPQKTGGWKFTDLYDFCAKADCSDGRDPSQPLVVMDSGDLVGVVASGADQDAGGVFRLASAKDARWSESVVHSFCSLPHCADGGNNASSLTLDASGNLYGTTPSGGDCIADFKCGAIFRIAPDGSESVLFDFCEQVGGCKLGSEPGTGVTLGPDGTLYGATSAGGRSGTGLVYSFNAGKTKVLHSVCGKNCEFATGIGSPLIIDPSGHLFGVEAEGEVAGFGGVIFELTP